MAIIDLTTEEEIRHKNHRISLSFIESVSGQTTSCNTLFGPIGENNYIVKIEELDNFRQKVSIDVGNAIKLMNSMDLYSGPATTNGVLAPNDVDWQESSAVPLRKLESYKQEDSKCGFCRQHGKRTTELFCDVPDREEYSNGWTHPVLAPGKISLTGVHEDCLAFVIGCVKELKEAKSEVFVSESLG